eukprot:1195979-Pyramimonas_sp.AAC.1
MPRTVGTRSAPMQRHSAMASACPRQAGQCTTRVSVLCRSCRWHAWRGMWRHCRRATLSPYWRASRQMVLSIVAAECRYAGKLSCRRFNPTLRGLASLLVMLPYKL